MVRKYSVTFIDQYQFLNIEGKELLCFYHKMKTNGVKQNAPKIMVESGSHFRDVRQMDDLTKKSICARIGHQRID